MKAGKIQVLGEMQYDGMVLIHNETLAAPATSVTIPNLNGDVDVEYELQIRAINGSGGGFAFYVQPNGDTTASNYGYQYLLGQNSSVGAARNNNTAGFRFEYEGPSAGAIVCGSCDIYAKSGFVRTAILTQADGIATTTVTGVSIVGWSWNNTSDNITSLVISSGTSGMAIGTSILLYARRSKV